MRNPIDPKTGLPIPSRTDRAPRSKRQGRVPGPADVAKIDAQVLRDPGLHATPEDFGTGIGDAVADFGKAASRVASDFAEMRREAEDDTAAMAGLSEARVRFTRLAESMKPQATTAEGLTGNLGKALSGETDAILRDLRDVRGLRPSKEGEAAIRRRLGVLASRMVVRGAMSEHRIRLAKLGHDVDFAAADAAMAAFNSPADVFAIIAETETNLARFTDKLPPDILEAKVAAARETIAGNAVAGLVEQGDVASARILLEAAGRGDGVSLSPDQAGRLRAAVDRVEDQARRARRPAAQAEIEDHLASIQATGAGLRGVTERARAALDGKAFKAFQRNEKDALAFHETMESLKFAPPDVIDRELATRRPKRGARNFAEKQRRFQVLERGAKQMLNLRARDGAAFVMEMGAVRAAVEGAGADGPDLRRALRFRMAMQLDIGMPEDRVRLLTRAEAGALAGEVQSAAVEDRAAKVAEVQDLYGPLFGRAMKELSEEGLDPRHRALAWARNTPALARTIARTLEPGRDGPEKDLDPAVVKDVRGRLGDATAEAASAAPPGGETAEDIKAVRSVAEDLALRYLRETGNVEESAARAAAFANDAIEEIRLAGFDAGKDDQPAGGAGDDTLTGGGQDGNGDEIPLVGPGGEGSGEDDAPAGEGEEVKQSELAAALNALGRGAARGIADRLVTLATGLAARGPREHAAGTLELARQFARKKTPKQEFDRFLKGVELQFPNETGERITRFAKDLRGGRLPPDAPPPKGLLEGLLTGSIKDEPLFKLAQRLREAGDETLPVLPENEDKLVVRVMGALGELAPTIMISFATGGVGGTALAAGDVVLLSSGQAVDKAIAGGASDPDAARAGLLGALAGGVSAATGGVAGKALGPVVDKAFAKLDRFGDAGKIKGIVAAAATRLIERGALPATVGAFEQFVENVVKRLVGLDPKSSLDKGMGTSAIEKVVIPKKR